MNLTKYIEQSMFETKFTTKQVYYVSACVCRTVCVVVFIAYGRFFETLNHEVHVTYQC